MGQRQFKPALNQTISVKNKQEFVEKPLSKYFHSINRVVIIQFYTSPRNENPRKIQNQTYHALNKSNCTPYKLPKQ